MPRSLRTTFGRYWFWARSLRGRLQAARRAFHTEVAGCRLALHRDGAFQVLYRRGTSDELVLAHSFSRDIFFPQLAHYRPEPHHIILDVGAHIGTFSILSATRVPEGKVYAIEACEQSATLLQANTLLNHCANVQVSHLALAAAQGRVRLYYDTLGGSWGHSITKKLSAHGEEVAADTLTNFLRDNQIATCNLMKLNCEGAEFAIILSSPLSTLAQVQNFLILYHSDMVEGPDEHALAGRLGEAGFQTRFLHRKGTRGWLLAENTACQER